MNDNVDFLAKNVDSQLIDMMTVVTVNSILSITLSSTLQGSPH